MKISFSSGWVAFVVAAWLFPALTKAETRDERVARLNQQAEAAVSREVLKKDSSHRDALQRCSSLYLNARYDRLTATRKMDDYRVGRIPVCFDPDNASCGVRVRDYLARFLLKQSKEGGCLKDKNKVRKLGRANGYDIVNDSKETTTVGQANFQADLYDNLFRTVTVATTESIGVIASVRNGVLELLIPEVSLKSCPKYDAVAAAVGRAISSEETKPVATIATVVDCLDTSGKQVAAQQGGPSGAAPAVADTVGTAKVAPVGKTVTAGAGSGGGENKGTAGTIASPAAPPAARVAPPAAAQVAPPVPSNPSGRRTISEAIERPATPSAAWFEDNTSGKSPPAGTPAKGK